MNELLARVLDAHGGTDRWNGSRKVGATIVTGGGFYALKGMLQDSDPRRVTVWLHEERLSLQPYGAPDMRNAFTPERVAIEKLDGTVVAERWAPKDAFAGHQMSTAWDALNRAYFDAVLIVAGKNDPLVPPPNGQFLADRLPHSRYTLLDAGHRIWEEAIGEYVAAVRRWFDGEYRVYGPS